jgi:hypothetical protein
MGDHGNPSPPALNDEYLDNNHSNCSLKNDLLSSLVLQRSGDLPFCERDEHNVQR